MAVIEGDKRGFNKQMSEWNGDLSVLESSSGWNSFGDSFLHLATRFGHCNIAVELLSAGVDVDCRNQIGETALHVAANLGHNGIGEILSSSSCYTCKKSCQQCP